MLELEGLESKRREQVTRVVVEFDDRWDFMDYLPYIC
jgi:hypothetical protein